MKLSELLGHEVVTESGEHLGRVHEVQLVQDGPLLGTWGAALRVDALVVGRASLRARLGLAGGRATGPWIVRALLRPRRGPEFVPWDHVVDIGDDRITVRPI